MPEFQLRHKSVADIHYIEHSFLLTYLGIKSHMKKHISKFLADIGVIFRNECVDKLVDFLHRVGTQ